MQQDTDWKINLRTLDRQRLTLMVIKDGAVLFRSGGRGLTPLVELLESNMDNLVGTTVVDRVVGIASAKLLLWQHVQHIDASIASEGAKDLLLNSGVMLYYDKLVPRLQDQKTGKPCEYELMAVKYDHPEDLYHALRSELLIFNK